MRKNIVNENWELEEVLDLNDLCAVLYKYGSNDAGYVEAFDFDDCKMRDAYNNLVNQYQEANANNLVQIYLVKLPSTNQVLSLLNSALYNGNERVPEAIEAVNALCNRADCETLCSWNGCLTEDKKKKKVCSSSYCGFTDPELNIRHFNQCMGTGGLQNPNSTHLTVGDVLPNTPVADTGSSDGASDAGNSSAGEGGAMGESLTEVTTNDLKANATVIDYVEYRHSYCHALAPNLKKLNYYANVANKSANYLKAVIKNIIKGSPEVRWTEKEVWFWNELNQPWPGAHKLYNFVKASIEKAHKTWVYVDSNGELIPELNAEFYEVPITEDVKKELQIQNNENIEEDNEELDPATTDEIEARGGLNNGEEKPIEESLNDGIDLEYSDLSVDDGEHNHTFSSFTYTADVEEVIKALSLLSGKDEEAVEADLDNLVDKYYNDLLDHFEDQAKDVALENYIDDQAGYDDHSWDEADIWYDTSWERESLTEAHIDYADQVDKMRRLEIKLANPSDPEGRGFNTANVSLDKLRVNYEICIDRNFKRARAYIENVLRDKGWGHYIKSTKIERRLVDYNYIGTDPKYFNEVASKTYWRDKNNPAIFIKDYGNSIEDLLVLYIFAKADGNINTARKLGEYIVERFTVTQLELINFASAILQNTGIAAVIEQQLNDRKAGSANTSNSTADRVSSSGAVIFDIDELKLGLCGLVNRHTEASLVINYCLSVTGIVRNLLMALIFAICLKKDATFIEKLKHTIIINCSYNTELIKETIKDCLGNTDKLNKINELIERARSLKTESLEENIELDEAKRYVKRYYVRPQNIFCSNKEDILKALLRVEGENCSVYSLKNLPDHDDVQELQPSDIIYYYDDGILYDKNHVKVMDYDLNVKHEEERKKFANVDTAPDAQVSQAYEDRLTDADLKDKEAVANFRAINQRQMK